MGTTRRKPGKGPGLKRTSVFFTTAQLARLVALHEASGVPVAVMIRRAVDAYLANEKRGH
jgi:hypothetical protein